jgi:hypothetical protein
MNGRRTFLDPLEIKKIVSLLSQTEMNIEDIAIRMHCSRSAVVAINRKWRVRQYSGLRTSWLVPATDFSSVER